MSSNLVDNECKKAESLINQGHLSEALAILYTIREKYPNDIYATMEITINIVDAYRSLGDYERASEELKRTNEKLAPKLRTLLSCIKSIDDASKMDSYDYQRLKEDMPEIRNILTSDKIRKLTLYNAGLIKKYSNELDEAELFFRSLLLEYERQTPGAEKLTPSMIAGPMFVCHKFTSSYSDELVGRWSFDPENQIIILQYLLNNSYTRTEQLRITINSKEGSRYYGIDTTGIEYVFISIPIEENTHSLNIESSLKPIPAEFEPIGFWRIQREGLQFLTLIFINIAENGSFHGMYDMYMAGQIIDCDFVGRWTFDKVNKTLHLIGQIGDKPTSEDIIIQGIISNYYFGTDAVGRKYYFSKMA